MVARWVVGDVVAPEQGHRLGGNYDHRACDFCCTEDAAVAVSLEDASSRYREALVCRECRRILTLSSIRPGEPSTPNEVLDREVEAVEPSICVDCGTADCVHRGEPEVEL